MVKTLTGVYMKCVIPLSTYDHQKYENETLDNLLDMYLKGPEAPLVLHWNTKEKALGTSARGFIPSMMELHQPGRYEK
jgi:hypothetical protein